MKHGLFSFLCILAGICPVLFAENLAFNGSFEMGTTGFALLRDIPFRDVQKCPFVPLELVKGAPNQGKNAVRIANPDGQIYGMLSKEFYLKAKTKYNVSCYLKSSKPGTGISVKLFKVDQRWTADGKYFTLDTQWKPYQFSFVTRNAGYFHFHLRPSNLQNPSKGDVYVDALYVQEEADHTPDTKLEAAVVPGKVFCYRGDTVSFTVKFFNPGKKTVTRDITIGMFDDYTGKQLWNQKFTVSLQPGTVNLPLFTRTLDRYGGFRFKIKEADIKSHDGFVPVFGKYTARPFDITKDTVVGFNAGLSAKNTLDTVHLLNAPVERRLEIFEAAGVRVIRDHDGGRRGVDWKSVEPEKGKFDFSFLDLQLKLYKKYNLTLFPVIGGGHIVRKGSAFPQWVKLRKIQTIPPNCIVSARGLVHMPDDKEYYDYIYETVKHLKGRVPVYEILNEPNLYLSPEDYIHVLKMTHDAIKKADPDAKLSGFCLSSDFSASSTPWMQQCVKLGGLNYVSVVGFHPYASRQSGSLYPADKYIANIQQEMKSYRKGDMPLLNTELYYLVDSHNHDFYTEQAAKPHHIITRFLLDLGEGVTQSMTVHSICLWKAMLTPNMRASSNQHETVPSENMVAYNTMARLFERAKPVGKFRYLNMVICYVYRDQNRKLIAAVWNYSGKQSLHADFSAFAVMDIFGNPEKPEIKELNDAPYYLTQGKMNEKEFLAKIKNLNVVLEQPISTGEFGRLAGNTLFVTLHNAAANPRSVFIGLDSKSLAAKKLVKCTVPGNGQFTVEIPVQVKKSADSEAALMILNSGKPFRRKIKVLKQPMINRTFHGKNFTGRVDFSNGRINLKVTVKDSTNAGPTGKRKPWHTDCVELFFDTEPLDIPEKFAHAYTKNTSRVFITPRDGKLAVSSGIKRSGCRHSVICGKNSYTIDFSMPLKTGKYLGFECQINDFNAAGKRCCYAQIGRGRDLYCSRCSFVLVRCSDPGN